MWVLFGGSHTSRGKNVHFIIWTNKMIYFPLALHIHKYAHIARTATPLRVMLTL